MTDQTENRLEQTNGPTTPDQIEDTVRARIAEIDKEIAQAREEKKALGIQIKKLDEEKANWRRMLPRRPQRRPSVAAVPAAE